MLTLKSGAEAVFSQCWGRAGELEKSRRRRPKSLTSEEDAAAPWEQTQTPGAGIGSWGEPALGCEDTRGCPQVRPQAQQHLWGPKARAACNRGLQPTEGPAGLGKVKSSPEGRYSTRSKETCFLEAPLTVPTVLFMLVMVVTAFCQHLNFPFFLLFIKVIHTHYAQITQLTLH